MKNNQVTFPQFCFLSFISSLVSLLFIDFNPSLLFFALIALSLLINNATVYLYKGNNYFLKILSGVYLTIFSVITCAEFCRYMYYDLSYGPMWAIAVIILAFSFFCTVKGLEPLYRASVIISAFIIASLIYVAASSFGNIKFSFNLFEIKSIMIPLILLFPSAIYILNFDNIIKEKRYTFNVYSVLIFITLIYFHLLPKNKVALGIFKGADGLMLAILTVAVIMFISGTAVALFKSYKHKYLSNSAYLSAIAVLTILTLYLFY